MAPLARAAGAKVHVDRRLVEVGYGAWTGQALPKLARTALWRVVQYRPSLARFPDGESLLEAQQRVVAALEEYRGVHTGNVLCAGHADMVKLALAHYAWMHVDLYQRVVVAPVSVSVLRFGDWGVQVERMNDTGGLGDVLPAPGRGGGRRRGQNRSGASREWGHA